MRVTPDNPSGWMQALLIPWLENPARDERQLVRWLQGLDLPPVDPNEEPYLWILRGLPPGGDLPGLEEKLAESIARLAGSAPDADLLAGDPDMFLFNLLELGARLRCEKTLAPPLRLFRDRNKLPGRKYLGMDLRHSLRLALTHNQPDSELEAVWMAMIEGRETPGLVGSSADGVKGILHMKIPGQPGDPPAHAIAEALTVYSQVLKNPAASAGKFAELLQLARKRFPGHFEGLAFIEMSDRQKWLEWTDMAIPELFFATGQSRYITWKPVYEFARQVNSVQVKRQFCDGRIQE